MTLVPAAKPSWRKPVLGQAARQLVTTAVGVLCLHYGNTFLAIGGCCGQMIVVAFCAQCLAVPLKYRCILVLPPLLIWFVVLGKPLADPNRIDPYQISKEIIWLVSTVAIAAALMAFVLREVGLRIRLPLVTPRPRAGRSLRDLFWLVFLAALAVNWFRQSSWPSGTLQDGLLYGLLAALGSTAFCLGLREPAISTSAILLLWLLTLALIGVASLSFGAALGALTVVPFATALSLRDAGWEWVGGDRAAGVKHEFAE